jgi:hypothetical protein
MREGREWKETMELGAAQSARFGLFNQLRSQLGSTGPARYCTGPGAEQGPRLIWSRGSVLLPGGDKVITERARHQASSPSMSLLWHHWHLADSPTVLSVFPVFFAPS